MTVPLKRSALQCPDCEVLRISSQRLRTEAPRSGLEEPAPSLSRGCSSARRSGRRLLEHLSFDRGGRLAFSGTCWRFRSIGHARYRRRLAELLETGGVPADQS